MSDCTHQWSGYAASFMYGGLIGSVRQCAYCGHLERIILGAYGDRRDRIAKYLTRRLARQGRLTA